METKNSNPQDPSDLSFNVMPQNGGPRNFSAPSPGPSMDSNTPPSSTGYSAPSSGSSHKWMYIIIGVVVLLILGGVAYYMLGTKKTDNATQTTSKLPKVWLNQYFNVDTCADQNTCGDDADPENDGLSNYEEFKALTNPLNPDTDSDGLADGDEVNIYKTDPTLKYTDRREVVAQNNWTDGYQIKNGFDPLTPALAFTEARKKQIADDTLKFKLHEPSISTTTSVPGQTNVTTFNNMEFGFEVQYPNNYKVSPNNLALPKDVVLLLNLKDDSTKAGIRITAKNQLDVPTKIKEYAPTGQEGVAPKTVKIGTNTFSYYGAGGGGVTYPDQYFINLNARFVIFTFDGPYANDKTISAAGKAIETQVLTSFKFTTTDQTANWKTYSDTKYGFEYKYPTGDNSSPMEIKTLSGYTFENPPAGTKFVFNSTNNTWSPSKDAPVLKTTNTLNWYLTHISDSLSAVSIALVPVPSQKIMVMITTSSDSNLQAILATFKVTK